MTPLLALQRRLGGAPLDEATCRAWAAAASAGQIPPYQEAVLAVTGAVSPWTEAERRLLGPLPQRAPTPTDGDPALTPTLAAKIRGEALSAAQIAAFVDAVTTHHASDTQVASFCAAVFLRGMDPTEAAALTREMTRSGDVLDLGDLRPLVDKHSTGGVGDKVSLPLAPVLAACGAYVPMVSGRGLGHTGGTLDKLEAIPGFQVALDGAAVEAVVREAGCAIVGQTARLAPADKRLYAIRDVTGTVGSIPLITASILSKKLAEGLDALVMDVKVGDGAFMKTEAEARVLAQSLVHTGQALSAEGGRPLVVSALLTAMDRPLGVGLGNALEVVESINCLRGGGPVELRGLVLAAAARLLVAVGLAPDLAWAGARAARALDDGSALACFRRMVAAQGGDVGCVDDPARLPRAPVVGEYHAPRAGIVGRLAPLVLGEIIVGLGGGRRTASDVVDPAVGLEVLAPLGARVEASAPLVRVHAADAAGLHRALDALGDAIAVGETPPRPLPLVLGEVP